jgi:[protein-PII] uridylyltransferase
MMPNDTLSIAVRPAAARAAAAVADLRRRIAEQHATGADPLATVALATELFDAVVCDVWAATLADLAPAQVATAAKVAIVAHGGYGRREMAPYSDIDLMILHDAGDVSATATVAARFVQDLFDAGLQVGQSVRTVSEACRLATGDATILSTLLDCRTLAGPATLADKLSTRLRRIVRRSPRRYAEALIEARQEEADRFGQTVSLLEPNVKRSPGGLRDIQLVRWLAVILHAAESLDELVAAGGISRSDAAVLRVAARFLTGVRLDMHLATDRATDDLSRDHQLRIASERGIEATDGLLGVERFMRAYTGHTRGVKRVADSVIASVSGRSSTGRLAAGLLGHRVEGLYRVGPGDVAALGGQEERIARDPAAILRLQELAMLHGLPVNGTTWDAVRRAGSERPWGEGPPNSASSETFLRLFEPPSAAVRQWHDTLGDSLRRLHEVGVLEHFVPGFAHARDLLQFNNYHKFTVDEHCIHTVEACLRFEADDGWLGRQWRAVTRPRPLLLAALLHDLGKGFPEDHSVVGARLARETCLRLGVPDDETEIVEFLVRRHLIMAHIAFRRDVGDDSLVVEFAREVGSPEILRMLALLTAADVSAVGPGVWTKWKADLLGDLHARTQDVLAGEAPGEEAARSREAAMRLVAERPADDPVVKRIVDLPPAAFRGVAPARVVEEIGRLSRLADDGVFAIARWQPETATTSISVGTHARLADGIFHRVAGALAAERLGILAADIHTLRDGSVLDRFSVRDDDFAGAPPPDRLADIVAAIRDAVVRAEPPAIPLRWNPFAPQVQQPAAAIPARVSFDTESSKDATIIEVFAHDSPALLFRLARAIHEERLSVRSARIGTYLDQVVDAFHVTDEGGRKVTDADRLACVRHAIERVIEPTAPAE